ncbi:Hypothetical protein LUCI_0753 [Lucifera butyrica]|uniref:Glycosyl transferases group 1 n=1 Tax=Lucifera butyrica TaxID=1351585 RepID=A0A498R5S1_9FIRM|nr:hypothetical protein [Lucifera butyrica]VBB05543.1 Hypothetical protein LUCI_0753 [Lucifera butyrica]
MQAIIREMQEICSLYTNNELSIGKIVALSHSNFKKIKAIYKGLDCEQQKKCVDFLEEVLETDEPQLSIYHSSCLLEITEQEKYLHQLITLALSPERTLQQKYFIYWQLIHKTFVKPALLSATVKLELYMFYKHIFQGFKRRLADNKQWIPATERNRNLIVLMANQLLNIGHGPTRTVIDRYRALKKLGKEVYIINTAELPRAALLPVFDPSIATLVEKFNEITTQFPLYQCRDIMPNEQEMAKILEFIASNKPEFIFSIGAPNITADLCSSMVPVATLANSFELPVTEGTFHLLPRELGEQDKDFLKKCGIDRKQIIETEYTYQFEPPVSLCTRQELGIPEDNFAVVVVGNRLDSEITMDYAQQIHEFLARNPETFISFIGKFDNFPRFNVQFITFQQQTNYLMYRKDLASVYDCCDAYLNPPRLGGGSSAAEALSRGLPVFTFPFGDVSYTAGQRYHIHSFTDIEKFIAKWRQKPEFRETEKQAAKARAAAISDTDGVMEKILTTIYSSDLFQ